MDIFIGKAFSVNEIDIRIALAKKLHRPPFRTDQPVNFHVQLYKNKGCGMLTLPTQKVGDTFLLTYGHTGIMVKGRMIEFRVSDKPLNEGRVRQILSIPWEDPKVLERQNRQMAIDSQPIKLQEFAFGHFRRDGSFLVDSDALGNGNIACDLDLRMIRLRTPDELCSESCSESNGYEADGYEADGYESDGDEADGYYESDGGVADGYEPDLGCEFDLSPVRTSRKVASYTPSQIKTVIVTDPSQTPYLVILDSDTPPVFESQLVVSDILAFPGFRESKQSSHRIPSLHDDCQMAPSCHSLCLTFSSHDEILIFLKRCRKLGLTSVQTRRDGIRTRHVSHIKSVVKLDFQLRAMKFELAFEVEKAVLDGDLEPSEILSLGKTIHYLSSTPGGLPPAAFRFFVTKLSRRRHMDPRGSMTRAAAAAPLSLGQQLIIATTEYYSVKSSSKITPYLVSPAIFESYHLIVTPTSRYLEGPVRDQSNSVLRRFGNHECFLRVSIQDEGRSKLRLGIDMSELLQSRFGALLTNGLHIGGRQYEFLGYSMSGLREHSVWFVTPFESTAGRMDAAKIRKKLVRPYPDSKL